MPIFSENSGPVTAAIPLTITTANQWQQVFPTQKRSYLLVQNNSDTDMWMAIGTSASVGVGIRLLAGGGAYVAESEFIPSGIVTIVCAVAGKQFYALQG
jgi:hypothetical protein